MSCGVASHPLVGRGGRGAGSRPARHTRGLSTGASGHARGLHRGGARGGGEGGKAGLILEHVVDEGHGEPLELLAQMLVSQHVLRNVCGLGAKVRLNAIPAGVRVPAPRTARR